MKTKVLTLIILIVAVTLSVMAQETDKKAAKEAKKLEKENQVKAMLDAKEFVFVAQRALPQGYKSVDLTTNPNFVKFHPDLIESSMPYYGRAYSGVGYGGDAGLKFEGKPEEFTIEKGKKSYEVKAKVKGTNDSYTITMSVFTDGSATMNISSNNRSTISYNGEIKAPEPKKENE
jgi:hypothetical protein